MLLSLEEQIRKHDLKINGILHGGAHLAEEATLYRQVGVGPVWWVEANPAVLPQIQRNILSYPEQKLIQALLYDQNDVDLTFNVTNYDGMSSSIYEFGSHPTFSPDTVFVNHLQLKTTTIDTLVAQHDIKVNTINLDLQGAELVALKGAVKLLPSIEYLFLEVNDEEVYIGCAKIDELDAFLSDFERLETYWVTAQGWGDAMWKRRR